jgi:hypothetical protein
MHESFPDFVFVRFVLALRLDFSAWLLVLWLGHSNNKHNFIMRSDDISIDALSLRINWPPTRVILLMSLMSIRCSFSIDDLIVGGATQSLGG